MNDFHRGVGRFRDAMRGEGERSSSPGLQAILAREHRSSGLRLRWAATAVVVMMLAAIPTYENVQKRQRLAEEKADALLLEQINAGLSRSVPRAMAPLLDWAPGN